VSQLVEFNAPLDKEDLLRISIDVKYNTSSYRMKHVELISRRMLD